MGDWEAHGPDAFGDFNISSKGEKLAKCVVVQNGFRTPEDTSLIAAHLVKAVNNHDALVNALRNARNYIDAVVINTPDKKKRRNYSECLRIIEAALKPVGGNAFRDAVSTSPERGNG